MSCAAGALPWMAPCCAECAQRAGAVGDPSPTSAPSTSTAGGASAGALLVLGLIFVGVVYGEKLLGKLGG